MAEFHFLRPYWFTALIPLALLLLRLKWGADPRRPWRGIVDHWLAEPLLVSPARVRTAAPLTLLAGAWLAVVTALAGPVWSRVPAPLFEPVREPVVLVVDLSSSMAEGERPPLADARLLLHDLAGSGRPTALVVYAASGHVLTPLTEDPKVLRAYLPALAAELMPAQGTRLDRGLMAADGLLDGAGGGHADVVVLTHVSGEGEALHAVRILRDKGRRVSVLDLGPGDPALSALADAGGGRYVAEPIPGGVALPGSREEQRHPAENVTREVWREEGPWLLLLLLPFAALAFRRGWLGGWIVVAGLGVQDVSAASWQDLWLTPDQQGVRELRQGRADEAAARFADPMWRGVALYRAGRYREAAAAFAEAAGPEAHYNRGNALVRAGDLEGALAAYKEALAADPNHADARFNRDRVAASLRPDDGPAEKGAERRPEQKESEPAPVKGQEQDGSVADNEGPSPAPEPKEPAAERLPETPPISGSGPVPGGGEKPDARARAPAAPDGGVTEPGRREREARAGAPRPDTSSRPDSRKGDDTENRPSRPVATDEPGSPGGKEADAPPEVREGERPEGMADRRSRPAPGGEGRAGAEPGETQADAPRPSAGARPPGEAAEARQVEEQWLQRIRERPEELLRERLRREYLRLDNPPRVEVPG